MLRTVFMAFWGTNFWVFVPIYARKPTDAEEGPQKPVGHGRSTVFR
jgi:hypothetical protein